jgi:adenylosuccinate synthase
LLLSGPIAVGKTTLAVHLRDGLAYEVIAVRSALEKALSLTSVHRAHLQDLGQRLEAETHGAWLADHVASVQAGIAAPLVVDALRTRAQASAIRDVVSHPLGHVHLTASSQSLSTRFSTRRNAELLDYAVISDALAHPVEAEVDDLAAVADLVLDTSALDAKAVATRVMDWLGRPGVPRR